MNDKEFLAHVGIMGMKWGHRKGASSSSSPKEDAKRAKILGDPSKLYKHRKEFTDEELTTAMKRLKMEKDIADISAARITRGKGYASAAMSFVQTAQSAAAFAISPEGKAVRAVVARMIKKAVTKK